MYNTKKVIYKVHCVTDENHVFEVALDVFEGKVPEVHEVSAYCPVCDTLASFEIEEPLVPNENLFRKYNVSIDQYR